MLFRLKLDLIQAKKDKDKLKNALLSTLVGEIEKIGKAKSNNEITEGRIIATINKFVADAKEVLKLAAEGSDMWLKAKAEIEILEKYLPKMVSEEDIEKHVQKVVAELGDKVNIGALMRSLKGEFGVSLDGKLANTIARGYVH